MGRLMIVLAVLAMGCGERQGSDFYANQADAHVAAAFAFYSPGSPAPTPTPDEPSGDCNVCNNTGCVRSGDGLSWVACHNCERECNRTAEPAASTELPRLIQAVYRPIATDATPAATSEPAAVCVDGSCGTGASTEAAHGRARAQFRRIWQSWRQRIRNRWGCR